MVLFYFIFFKSLSISIIFVSNIFDRSTSYRLICIIIIDPNRIFIAIDPNHFGRSEIVSPARWLFLQLLACELILQFGPNTNTLCGGCDLERERNRLMKTTSARVSKDCEANKSNVARRVVLRRTKGGLVACSRRTPSKHAPLGTPSPLPLVSSPFV